MWQDIHRGLKMFIEMSKAKYKNKTSVIHDQLSQTHSLASSEHLKFVLLW